MKMQSYKGFTLVEMLISIMLGIIIILGLTTVYVSSQKSSSTRNAIANMEANARIALSAMRQTIKHAGYPSIYNIPIEKPFHSAEDGAINITQKCRNNTELLVKPSSIKNKVTRDNGFKDQLIVKYIADNVNNPKAQVTTDCLGVVVPITCSGDPDNGMLNPANAVVYNALYINDKNTLLCAGSRVSIPQPLAEDIVQMQFLYGVNNGAGVAYLTATEVEANSQWFSVISVQVAILVRSQNDILKQKEQRAFVLLDNQIFKDDKRLYRVYSTTINLPNRNTRRVL
ncbi:MAG: PilW family protein [Cocleimonas sp.]|nr:PilW family protein [Cocleimonas sp.]